MEVKEVLLSPKATNIKAQGETLGLMSKRDRSLKGSNKSVENLAHLL